MIIPSEEQESAPKTRDFTRLWGYYLINFEEASMALSSVFFVGFYTFYNPHGSDWVPRLDNTTMALIYLVLSFAGFATNMVLNVKTKRQLRTEGVLRVSIARVLILFAPPFLILAGPGGALLTLVLGGASLALSGSSLALGTVVLYGFVIGFLAGRIASKIIGLRSWRVTQIENENKRGYFQDIMISDRYNDRVW